MANEQQFKSKTLYIATRGVREYRASIKKCINQKDTILEIGCEWGTTSKFLFQNAKHVVATDVSSTCITRARSLYPEIQFETLDVFNIKAAMNLQIDFNKMYIDVSGLSGYRSLLDVISLLEMYSSVFNLEMVIIKSGSLKNFSRRCIAWEDS